MQGWSDFAVLVNDRRVKLSFWRDVKTLVNYITVFFNIYLFILQHGVVHVAIYSRVLEGARPKSLSRLCLCSDARCFN